MAFPVIPNEVQEQSDLETVFNKLVFEKEEEFELERNIVESYGSTILTSIDIEPPGYGNGELVSKFVYNTFITDETTNDSGISPFKFRQVNIDNEQIVKQVNVPRYVELRWAPLYLESDFLGLILPQYRLDQLERFHKEGRINDLAAYSNGSFFSLILRDSTADNKLYTIVSSSYEMMKQEKEFAEAAGASPRGNIIEDQILEGLSTIEQARLVNADINSSATREFFDQNIFSQELGAQGDAADEEVSQLIESIVNNFGSEQQEDDYQITDQFGESKKVEHVNMLKSIPLKAIVNNKYLYTIAKNVENDESSIFADEFRNLAFVFKQLEFDAITQSSIQKYELGALARSITSVDAIQESNLCSAMPGNDPNGAREGREERINSYFQNESYKTAYRTVGYFIEKYFVDDFGNKKIYDPILIDNQEANAYTDTEVVYGVTYHYTVKTLVEYLIPIMSGEVKKIARILLKSDGVHTEVRTTESIPPPPPQDFSIMYSNSEKAPCLTWARDISSQQDVVKYLIFKRLSIDDPFTMIGLINFTPVSYPAQQPKYVIDNNVVTFNESYGMTKFVDKSFNANESAIYAIIAGDAHELYSNYSIQLQVMLDKRTNKLDIKQISNSGAPIPYPNFYVNESIFNKAIFSQNSKKIKLIFNPDLIDVNIGDERGNNISKHSVVFSNNISDKIDENDESYKINIVNTDLNVSRVIDIKINDNRTILK